jgi:hypothetical protein
MHELPSSPRVICMKSLWVRQMATLPLEPKWRYTPCRGTLVKTWYFSLGVHTFAAVRALLTQTPQSCQVSSVIKPSRHAWIPSPPAKPVVLVLWLNQVTQWFCGEPPLTPKPLVQTPIVSHYPALAHVYDFVLLFFPPCGPHLTPFCHWSIEPSLFVSPLLGGPTRLRPFAPALHFNQHKSSRNLHLQYSAKSQSTPRCQLLIITGSDHTPFPRRFGPQLATVAVGARGRGGSGRGAWGRGGSGGG